MKLTQQQNLQKILTLAHFNYEKCLNARAFFKLSNRENGKDLVQQTFMKTWIYLTKGGEIKNMKAFLYHVLNNLIIDEYRKKKSFSLDVLMEKGFNPSVDDSKNIFNVLDGKAAFLLLARLPKKYKRIMIMRYGQDLSLKEMSLATGELKNNISVQLHRGLNKLKLLYHNG